MSVYFTTHNDNLSDHDRQITDLHNRGYRPIGGVACVLVKGLYVDKVVYNQTMYREEPEK